MTARVKSVLLLAITLLLGMVLGALLNARLADQRIERIALMRSQRGFVQAMERAIEPRDDAQRDAVRAILEGAAERVDVHFRTTRADMQAILDSTKDALAGVLTDAQMAQLDEQLELQRPPPPPSGGRPPPDRPPVHTPER